jgi:serine/threonine protein kinase
VADPNRKRRFIQEARAASALNHPNIVTIYDIDEADGVHFIAMGYVQGKTLDRLIARHGLRVTEALRYAVQMAAALAKAHSAGIVHRNLKPTNVMVTDDGLVKVLDFGLAKLTEAAPTSEAETLATVGPAACVLWQNWRSKRTWRPKRNSPLCALPSVP